MNDPLARRLAAAALALSLLALVLATFATLRADGELRDLRMAVEAAVQGQRQPTLGPGPSLDEEL